jgi:hypothetical protein
MPTTELPPDNDTRVVVLGQHPPLGSQEEIRPHNPIPSYAWEATSPVNGRSSGMYVLQWGSPPNFPHAHLSRDPPNQVLNRRGLREALRGAIVRGRRDSATQRRLALENPASEENLVPVEGEGARGRRGGRARGRGGRGGRGLGTVVSGRGRARRFGEGAAGTSVTLLAGWQPPEILVDSRSPIFLSPRSQQKSHTIVGANEAELIEDVTATKPGVFVTPLPWHGFTTPPRQGVGAAITISPTHQSVPCAFPRAVHVRVKLATLGIDPSLWGHIDEFSGTIVDRYVVFFVAFFFLEVLLFCNGWRKC